MSGIELLVDEVDGRLHCAVTRKQGLTDLYADALDMTGSWASLYLGRVVKLDTKLDAAIVDLGNGLQGILPAKHVHFAGGDASEKRTGIANILKGGQMLLVQIKSEGKRASSNENHKMPRLTTKLYVLGHHLVYCPLSSPVTMSRQIEREDVLSMAGKLKAKGGWILQPHAEEENLDVLQAEAQKLLEEWDVILGAEKSSEGKPRLLKGGPTALHRILFDYGAEAFDHIHVGNRKLFDAMSQWCAKYDPPLSTSKRLRLYKPEKPGQTLFDMEDVASELDMLSESRIDLACGGSIIIEPVQALTVVDVNRGSADTVMKANEEAALETARQLRLRNISGAILIDFIGMEERSQRASLMDLLNETFEGDPGGAQVHGFTRLGIVEMTRKRRSGSYAEKSG
ncbi:MAG: ribonuclease E/G [Alphaproteobacteria bacterium]